MEGGKKGSYYRVFMLRSTITEGYSCILKAHTAGHTGTFE